MCDCTHEEKIKFEGLTQNGCYGNQPYSFEVLIYSTDSIDAISFCSFTKQDLSFKQAHQFRSAMSQSFDSYLLFLVLQVGFLERALFCNKPRGDIFQCHMTDVKLLRFVFWFIASRHYWSLSNPSFRNFSSIISKVELLA